MRTLCLALVLSAQVGYGQVILGGGSAALPNQAPVPTITPTPNTNLLSYTNTLATEWNVDLGTGTGGQSDESSGTTATLFIPSTANAVHSVFWLPETIFSATTQTVSLSVYVKPSGYNFANIGFHTAFGSTAAWFDSFFNVSTCATVSIAAGVTATATAAGNGYCLITETYSLTAFYHLDRFYLTTVPSSGTVSFAGDGTSGGLFANPQISFNSTPQTYQPVTGIQRYCVAAYNDVGQTSGCSQWANGQQVIPSLSPSTNRNAEVNSIVTSAVTGASYCKVFRSNGATTGALIVSGNSHIACGNTVNDNYLTADGSTAPSSTTTTDERPQQLQSLEYTVPQHVTRLLTVEPGLAGTITSIHISVSGVDTTAPNSAYLQFRCNGAAAPGEQVDMGTFLMLQDLPVLPFMKDRIGMGAANATSGNYSFNRELEIPFTTGCIVDLVNSSGINGVFSEVSYRPGYRLSSPLRAVWHAGLTSTTAASAFALVNLLSPVTSAGGGELESVTLWVAPTTASYGYQEGNPAIITDGTVAVVANGTEDFFGSGFGFNGNSASLQSDKWGDFLGSALSHPAGSDDILMYRFFGSVHHADSVTFANSLAATWQVGQQGQTSSAVNVNYKSLVTYWTAQ